MRRVALITGANKGIGFNIAAQLLASDPRLAVLVGARDASKGVEAVAKLASPNAHSILIDVNSETSIAQAAAQVKKEYDGLDILVNNAGIIVPGQLTAASTKAMLQTNYYGTLHTINSFLPLMRPQGRIINVASELAMAARQQLSPAMRDRFFDPNLTVDQLNQLLAEYESSVADKTFKAKGFAGSPYGMSKLGVAILTRILARTAMRDGITVNCGCPGWCRTDMTSPKAPRSAEEGASNFSHLALLPHDQLTNGEFWEDKKVSSLERPFRAAV